MALWIDYSTFYGECPLKELLGVNFVIVNERLQDEFEEFKGKIIQCTIGTTHTLVKGADLLLKTISIYYQTRTVLVTKRAKNHYFQFFYNISTIEHARAMQITFLESACISES